MAVASPLTSAFLRAVPIYRKSYVQKIEAYETDWRGQRALCEHWTGGRGTLNNTVVESALAGTLTIAAYGTTATHVIALDIDAHGVRSDSERRRILVALYERTVSAFDRHYPSLLYRTPNGLHAYYLLAEWRPSVVLKNEFADKLLANGILPPSRGIGVEVKLTHREALRLPRKDSQLDPETLQPIDFAPDGYLYYPDELIGERGTTEYARESIKKRKSHLRNLTAADLSICRAESQAAPFVNGGTNEPYKRLIVAYIASELTRDESIKRILKIARNSPRYTGGLLNFRTVRSKVDSSYRNLKATGALGGGSETAFQTELGDADLIASLVTICPQKLRKRATILLERLLAWQRWQDSIFADPAAVSVQDFLYRYYRHNRRRGLYPLPSSMLKRWGGFRYYREIIDWLESVGVLSASEGFDYSSFLGVCRYYRIQLEAKSSLRIESAPLDPIEVLRRAVLASSQKQVAAHLSIDQSYVSFLLSGKRNPSADVAENILRTLWGAKP